MRKCLFLVTAIVFVTISLQAQITLSPVIDSSVGGLTENNKSIIEGRLHKIISSMGMESGYGGRFVLACKVAALQREVAGTKLVQHLEVSFAIGDNAANICFGTTSVETFGAGNSEGQAMTSALKNIRVTPELKALVAQAKPRILDFYEQNGPAIIKRAKALADANQWEYALFELTCIPAECSCFKEAMKLIKPIYTTYVNHDAKQILNEAQAVWSANPAPGPSADEAMRILSQIDSSADCYPQAQALMRRIEQRVQNVTDQVYEDAVAMENARASNEAALEKERIRACRDISVEKARAEANRPVVNTTFVFNSFFSLWWWL